MRLKISAQLSLDFGLLSRQAKVIIVRAYTRVRNGVKEFVRAHCRER